MKKMKAFDKVSLYWNTIKVLKPVQIIHQIKNRVFEERKTGNGNSRNITAPAHRDIRIVIPQLDENERYLERFDTESLLADEVTLLHEKHHLAWNVPEASHLWNYNLHYLEFLIPLAAAYKRTLDKQYKEKWQEIIHSWLHLKGAKDSGDVSTPYTISMRIPNLLICLELLGDELDDGMKEAVYASIYQQYRYLIGHQELALLANHYYENLKTIVISSLLFNELDVYHTYFHLFLEQTDEQILPDGVHFERSLMYHKIILEDILRVYTVLKSSGHTLDANKLIPTVKVMADALDGIETGFIRTPLFNDAGNNVSKDTVSLLRTASDYCGWKKGIHRSGYPDAGYYRLDGNSEGRMFVLLFDCGDIGPGYMGGHAHNDCLSFELAVDGAVIVANSGTGLYQGERRQFFRSTMAHNTVMIDDREQSELWGEHRVGRRLKEIHASTDGKVLTGQFRSYIGDVFRRKMWWRRNRLVIQDDIRSCDRAPHTARHFFHLTPGYRYVRMEDGVMIFRNNEAVAKIRLQALSVFRIHTKGRLTAYAEDFGRYERKEVLEVRTRFQDGIRLNIEIEILK